MCRRAGGERVGSLGGNQQGCQRGSGSRGGSRDDSGRGGSREGGSGDSVQPAPGTS
jgi:hypothetical protein